MLERSTDNAYWEVFLDWYVTCPVARLAYGRAHSRRVRTGHLTTGYRVFDGFLGTYLVHFFGSSPKHEALRHDLTYADWFSDSTIAFRSYVTYLCETMNSWTLSDRIKMQARDKLFDIWQRLCPLGRHCYPVNIWLGGQFAEHHRLSILL